MNIRKNTYQNVQYVFENVNADIYPHLFDACALQPAAVPNSPERLNSRRAIASFREA
jgi:hypothetical protein